MCNSHLNQLNSTIDCLGCCQFQMIHVYNEDAVSNDGSQIHLNIFMHCTQVQIQPVFCFRFWMGCARAYLRVDFIDTHMYTLHVRIYLYRYTKIHTQTCAHAHICICMYLWIHACMYIHTYMYVLICICIQICLCGVHAFGHFHIDLSYFPPNKRRKLVSNRCSFLLFGLTTEPVGTT